MPIRRKIQASTCTILGGKPDATMGEAGEASAKALDATSFKREYDVQTGAVDWDILCESRCLPRLDMLRRWADWALGNGWHNSVENYIGTRLYYRELSDEITYSILSSPTLQDHMQKLAERRADAILAHVRDGRIAPNVLAALLAKPESPDVPQTPKASKMRSLSELLPGKPHGDIEQAFRLYVHNRLVQGLLAQAQQSMAENSAQMTVKAYVRFFGLSVNELLLALYNHGIHVRLDQMLALRRVAKEALDRKQTILFVPCHKSHVDYLLFSFLLYRMGIALPHIIAGKNLDLPVMGEVLRHNGAMFVRRTFHGDELYPKLIKEYIMELIARGMNIEVFIEGTRSRTGKLLAPRYGILKYLVEAIHTERTSDILVCPVSLQYDSVIETSEYVGELLGKPKIAESLYNLVANASYILRRKLGRIDVRICTPWSLREFLRVEHQRYAHHSEPNDNAVLKAFGYRILNDINATAVVMPAALVGTVLLTQYGRGLSRSALIEGVTRLRQRILAKGYEVADFGLRDIGEMVDRAIALMRRLVTVHAENHEPLYEPVHVFELSFYRNQVMHIFVHEGLFCAALYTSVKRGEARRMSYTELVDTCGFISRLLSDEFVYAMGTLENNMHETVARLVREDVICVTTDNGKPATLDDWVAGRASLGLTLAECTSGRSIFNMYLSFTWTYIECYWVAALTLFALGPRPGKDSLSWFAFADLIPAAQRIGHLLFYEGKLSYYESMNGAALKNAFEHYLQHGILVTRFYGERKPIKLVALHADWVPRVTSAEAAPPDESAAVPALGSDLVLSGRLVAYSTRIMHFCHDTRAHRSQELASVYQQVLDGAPAPHPASVEFKS